MNKLISTLSQVDDDRLRTILQAIPDLIWLKDMNGVYLTCNHRFEQFFGALEKDIIGHTDYDFVSKELADSFRENDRIAMMKGGPSKNEEWVTFADDGHQELLEATKTPLLDKEGQLIGVLGISRDITQRKKSEMFEKFRSSTLELLTGDTPLTVILEFIVQGVEQLNSAMNCSILLLDEEGKHLGHGIAPSLPAFYNAAIDGVAIGMGVGSCGTAAYTGERVIVEDIATHPYWAPYKTLAAKAGLGACWSEPIRSSFNQVLGTFAIYHKDKNYPSEADIYVIEQSAHLASIAIERKLLEEKVRQLAFYDTLTNLPNRRLLKERLNQAMSVSKRTHCYCALMFIDLDNFKPINDMHGHGIGDLLLIDAAKRLKSCVREMDTVARFGGDEFVVLLSELDVDQAISTSQAQRVAQKIRAALSVPYVLPTDILPAATIEHHCTASIGVTVFLNQGINQDDILKQADAAMYEAKEAGGNSIRFHDNLKN
jgi:diguanylate cyclase (GGDEF)-like protein/PAS domain S-box-containing protein